MRRRWRIRTPGGWFVYGVTGATADEVWSKYCRVMNQTREQLEVKGYVATDWWYGRKVS